MFNGSRVAIKAGFSKAGKIKNPAPDECAGFLKNLSKTERHFSSLFTWSKSP
jgi:hypothetical protein